MHTTAKKMTSALTIFKDSWRKLNIEARQVVWLIRFGFWPLPNTFIRQNLCFESKENYYQRWKTVHSNKFILQKSLKLLECTYSSTYPGNKWRSLLELGTVKSRNDLYAHNSKCKKIVNLDSEQIIFFTTYLDNIKYAVKMFSFMYGLLKYVPLNCRGH